MWRMSNRNSGHVLIIQIEPLKLLLLENERFKYVIACNLVYSFLTYMGLKAAQRWRNDKRLQEEEAVKKR